ncbi:hypothetical protein [Candidatus Korarchaeum cryptofilum]|jgi:crenactin|uniref:Actin/actin family protein n=1 Tax=Korarchaeum cryptofilum (strain OPF8) TaxID=374847 RepID=B1L6E7_KORCO|nr:hypothetical protein [Candidatus Korarchaeum cryptofilum]ACB08026.1 actin/actin family protein [Candidatus Korarchaeum cryptofilum OPF8]
MLAQPKPVFASDFGTSFYKFGPWWMMKTGPSVIENRGYFPKISKVSAEVRGISVKEVVVGDEVSEYLESRADLSRLYYPMRNGVIEREDQRGWKVVKELVRYSLLKHYPGRVDTTGIPFSGFFVVAALAAQAPTYMYERLFEIYQEVNSEEGGGLVRAVTIIPQPLAVAIAEKAVTCVVVEAGHGNTQVTPISRDVIRAALIPLNRGGSDSDKITAQILKDLGYSDLAREEKFVRIFKEMAGLLPLDLNKAIPWSKDHPGALQSVFRIPGTTVEIDMGEKAWQRFLIGEFFFNPGHEIFESYYSRGFTPPKDTLIGGEVIPGNVTLAEAIRLSISKIPVELQTSVSRRIILSGGAFNWSVPKGLEGIATDSPTKLKNMLRSIGLEVDPKIVSDPQFSVWRGSIVYGMAVSEGIKWDWSKMEGWYYLS